MDKQTQVNQLEPTYSSSVPIQDVAPKTCWKQWTIEKGGEKGSGISVLMVRHDDGMQNEVHVVLRLLSKKTSQATQIQPLNKALCYSLIDNTIGKDTNSTIHLPLKGEVIGQTVLIYFRKETGQEGNLRIKTAKN